MLRKHECPACDFSWDCQDPEECTIGRDYMCWECSATVCPPETAWIKVKFDVNPNIMVCERCKCEKEVMNTDRYGIGLLIDEYVAMMHVFKYRHKECEEETQDGKENGNGGGESTVTGTEGEA